MSWTLRRLPLAAALLATVSFAASALAQPQWGVHHAAYGRAFNDLRTARALLFRAGARHPNERWDDQAAIHEIDEAMRDVGLAAADDNFRVGNFTEPEGGRWGDRVHRAMELLNSAYRDIDFEEDNPAAQAPRSRALGHLSRARQAVHQAMIDNRW